MPESTPEESPLDVLHLRYLDTVSAYQAQLRQLTTHLSDGYLHLATANFHTSNPLQRYGKDSYNGRMRAMHGVSISLAGDEVKFEVADIPLEDTASSEAEKKEDSTLRQRKAAPDAPQREGKPQVLKFDPRDPLRWYTLLPPTSLRSAQSSFLHSLPAITSLAGTLRSLSVLSEKIEHLKRTDYVYKILPSPPIVPIPLLPLDENSGFVHMCMDVQVLGVVTRFVADAEALWVVRIPYAKVAESIKWETPVMDGGEERGEEFPHYFGRKLGMDGGVAEWRWGKMEKGDWDAAWEGIKWKPFEEQQEQK